MKKIEKTTIGRKSLEEYKNPEEVNLILERLKAGEKIPRFSRTPHKTFIGSIKLSKSDRLIYETNDDVVLIIFCGKHNQYEHYLKKGLQGKFKQYF